MVLAVWIVSGLLAVVYLIAGSAKLRSGYDELKARNAWVGDITPGTLRLIAAVEIVGAIALIVPPAAGIVPVFATMAAVGFMILQGVAIAVHLNHREQRVLPVNITLLVMAAFVAIARYAGV